jgi:hypothetical protein
MQCRYHEKESKEMQTLYLKETSIILSIPKQAIWTLDVVISRV